MWFMSCCAAKGANDGSKAADNNAASTSIREELNRLASRS
jgi:hypothetical protein